MKRDNVIFDLIQKERSRQTNGIELIASENFVSDQVMEAMGSVMTNKYAEGYPGKRYYGGCQIVDQDVYPLPLVHAAAVPVGRHQLEIFIGESFCRTMV